MPKITFIKSRIDNVRKIKKITQAMQVVATTRLHKRKPELLQFRPYANAAQEIYSRLSLTARPVLSRSACAVIFASDRGFCGGFNNAVFAAFEQARKEIAFSSCICIGKKGFKKVQDLKLDVRLQAQKPAVKETGQLIDIIRQNLSMGILKNEIDAVYVFFNKFHEHILGKARSEKIYPFEKSGPQQGKQQLRPDFIFEAEQQALEKKAGDLFIRSRIELAIKESSASEEMARMLSMKQATDSAEDMASSLSQQYHKARQALITSEIIEILGASGM